MSDSINLPATTNVVLLSPIITQYIDSLTDIERDRIISATSFKTGGGYAPARPYVPESTGEKTIIAAREMTTNKYGRPSFDRKAGRVTRTKRIVYTIPEQPATETTGCLIDHAKAGASTEGYGTIGVAFDTLYRDHKDDFIHALKEYAAKGNKIELPAESVEEMPIIQQEVEHANS